MGGLPEVPGTDSLGLRDRAILETPCATGLRRTELCNLDVYDVDHEAGVVLVRGGKGCRDRYVPIGGHALDAIRSYFREARTRLAGRASGPALFLVLITHRRLDEKTWGLPRTKIKRILCWLGTTRPGRGGS